MLLDETAKHVFTDYRKAAAPKAFAVSMSGAYAVVEGATTDDDAAKRAVSRCQEYARTCLLYALGEKIVAGMKEPPLETARARRGRRPGGEQLSLRPGR